MPDKNWSGLTPPLPIATINSSATYAINGGATLAAGAETTPTAITFTGLATTDGNVGIAPRDAANVPPGLSLIAAVVTANTLTVTWKNTSGLPITPPAASTWTCAIFKSFLRVS